MTPGQRRVSQCATGTTGGTGPRAGRPPPLPGAEGSDHGHRPARGTVPRSTPRVASRKPASGTGPTDGRTVTRLSSPASGTLVRPGLRPPFRLSDPGRRRTVVTRACQTNPRSLTTAGRVAPGDEPLDAGPDVPSNGRGGRGDRAWSWSSRHGVSEGRIPRPSVRRTGSAQKPRVPRTSGRPRPATVPASASSATTTARSWLGRRPLGRRVQDSGRVTPPSALSDSGDPGRERAVPPASDVAQVDQVRRDRGHAGPHFASFGGHHR